MTQKHITPCSVPQDGEPILDPAPVICPDPTDAPSLKQVPGRPDMGWNEQPTFQKTGLGSAWNNDPMQAGRIINDPANPDRTTIYRYSQAIRGCDEAMVDLFRDIVIEDEDGKVYPVPIIWGSQEKAIEVILSENYRKDNSNVVDRIRLPMLAIVQKSLQFAPERYIYHRAVDYMREYQRDGKPGFTTQEKYSRDTVFGVARGLPYDVGYTLYLWVKFEEDWNQIVEQIISKFSHLAYIRVRGVGWEIAVKLNQIGDNKNLEPGDKNLRVLKFEFDMTAETYIPQPIVRKKAVLRARVEVLDGLTDAEASSVLARFDEVAKEIE